MALLLRYREDGCLSAGGGGEEEQKFTERQRGKESRWVLCFF